MNHLINLSKVHFLGIGGIGMSALARYFLSRGMDISGYDKTPSPLTHQLEEEGMLIHYEDRPDLIPEAVDLVVRTPAVPDNLHEYRYCVEHNIPLLKRAEVLGLYQKNILPSP